jgi:hypothetical protein
MKPYLKNNLKAKRAEGKVQVVECLPSKHKSWAQTPVLPKKKKKKKKGGGREQTQAQYTGNQGIQLNHPEALFPRSAVWKFLLDKSHYLGTS